MRPRRFPHVAHPLVFVAQHPSDIAATPVAWLDRLRSEGFDVWVSSPDVDALDEIAYEGFRVLPIPGQLERNVAAWLGAYVMLQAHFLQIRPSLVHGIGIPWAFIASFAAHRAEAAAVIATIDRLAEPRLLSQLVDRMPGAVRRRLEVADPHALLGSWVHACLATHEVVLARLLESNAIEGEKLELVLGGHGVDLEAFDVDVVPTSELARQRLDVPPSARWVVGAAGPWTKACVRNLRRFEHELARTHPAAVWLAAGASEGPAALVSDRTPAFFRALDMFVALDPRDWETTAMMEAAALGVPTVAIDSPAARTVVADGRSGRIVSDDALVEVLRSLLDDPATRRELGRGALARARERFDRRHVEEQMLGVYERTLRRGLQ